MFKTFLTAAAFALTASLAHAASAPLDLSGEIAAAAPAAEEGAQIQQVHHYCEWVTIYDYSGNWITVWQCY